ncbi:hypothetical protein AZF37_03450 [endosymbiont 'TC1' of Trimyema compressum]|uniref:InlB B-repeat-containing protein n=1 Tax=endosymbiont 'TC1' of Trimyema compressum TaxID=243899 RepID=UPI0007F09800|nr:InlB B-repeat-containing protein [endosymbiont 'TC1' of Trimyema compressum]AMP20350.1 hypothetical protein AZF37_03450 [endosymbiont 'TC1' of Trimyema compressum]
MLELNFKVTYYNLSFDLNDNIGKEPICESLCEGDKITAPLISVGVGYILKGWNTVRDGSGVMWDFKNATMPAQDVILYAQWKKTKSDNNNDEISKKR